MSPLVLLGALALAAKPYGIQDLEALGESKAYVELAQHLGDIPPSKRDAAWTKLATTALLGLLEQAAETRDVLRGIEASEALLDQFPNLRKSEAIMTQRGEVGILAFARCYAAGWSESCGEALFTFVARDPSRPSLALRAAKLTRREMKPWYAAPLFKRALEADEVCKDEDLSLSALSALALPGDDPQYVKYVEDGRSIAEACYPVLKEQLELKLSDNAYVKTNACPVVKRRSDAGRIAKKVCG